MWILKHLFILMILSLPVPVAADNLPVLHHVLRVMPDVKTGSLQVEDTLTVPNTLRHDGQFTFTLGSAFSLNSPRTQALAPNRYSMTLPPEQQAITLTYSGKLASTPDCAWLTQTCVLLNERGMYLDGNSQWYPQVTDALHTFDLQVRLPEAWVSLSQGEQTATGWRETHPQDSIHLIAGKFHVYQQPGKHATAMVYLQTADETLAKRYLQTSQKYIDSYSALLGDYPYAKFATVESFWETGWGMPSFTLLGSRVMRLPFILDSAFPHEILHNWWGNGVYVDASHGNWSEGLTAYLADQRIKEQQGEGVEYRRSALQKYATFVGEQADFPIASFRSRHDATTQAIGYDKSLMLFHMLRRQLGDEKFLSGLKGFYRDFRFRPATFGDLLAALQANASFQREWLETTGAPQLKIASHTLKPVASGYQLELGLEQTQVGKAFPLDIPARLQFLDSKQAEQRETLHMTQAKQTFTLKLPAKPKRLALDPDFDLFRLPDPAELPASIGVLYGKESKTYVLSRKTERRCKLRGKAGWMR